MKKYMSLLILFFLIISIPIIVNAEECNENNISIESVTLESKSNGSSEITPISLNGKNINLDLSMNDIGDNIKYKIIIKNNSSKDYNIDKNSINSNYINYSLVFSDGSNLVKSKETKTAYLLVEYKNKVPDNLFNENIFNDNNNIIFNLIDIKNPKTKNNYLYIIFLITLIIFILYKNKSIFKSLLILSIIITPFTVKGICNFKINIDSKVKIIKHEQGPVKATDKIKNLVKDAPSNSTDVIEAENVSDECTNTLAYDGTTDNNLRYVGANPCNYVSFNNEVWRIIGVMNNIDDGEGNKETRIKLMRNEALGSYSWDTSPSDVNSGYGINDWTQADLMNELNGDYLDTTLTENKNWYNGENNNQTGIFYKINSLNAMAQEQIKNVKWNLGGYTIAKAPASTFYEEERGTTVYNLRPHSWTGKVALIYPSDFGYAIGGNIRNTCLLKDLFDYDKDNCNANNWLNLPLSYWTLTPYSNYSLISFTVNKKGNLSNAYNFENLLVFPSTYLKSNITIINGNGTPENPYILE